MSKKSSPLRHKWMKLPFSAKMLGLGFSIADKRTPVWWENVKVRKSGRLHRMDNVIGLSRHYLRGQKVYIWHLVIFKLNVLISVI